MAFRGLAVMLCQSSAGAASWSAALWRRDCRLRAVAGLALVVLFVPSGYSSAAARFWISAADALPPGPDPAPEAPSIMGANGIDRTLYIWAQPESGKKLRNFSLNLWTDNPSVVDFSSVQDSIVVYNGPEHETTQRFQYVHDSTQGLAPTGPSTFAPYRIRGIQGFSVSDDLVTYTGVGGNTCAPGDLYCVDPANGPPAWLIASVKTRAEVDSGLANYYLQIGQRGMNHSFNNVIETTSATSVIFGIGSVPEYNADADREKTFGNDSADVTLKAIRRMAGDYRVDGKVDARDYVIWRKKFAEPSWTYSPLPDGDGNGIVNALDLEAWKVTYGNMNMGGGGGGNASASVPEPTSGLLFVIGYFWIACGRGQRRRRTI
jgi:hypothetical protein